MAQFMTLAEYAKDSDALTQKFVEIFADEADFLGAMRWKTIAGGSYTYHRESSLPGIAFRGINETFTPDVGVINPLTERVFTMGGEIEIDNFLLRTHGSDRKAREVSMKAKKAARVLADAIILGDNSTQPRQFDGLRRRITGGQLIANSAASGGAALSLYNLDRLIDSVRGENKILLMSRTLRTRFMQAARTTSVAGFVMRQEGELSRVYTSYQGVPIYVGYEAGPDGLFLPFNEVAAGGGGAVTSSIYCLSIREGGLEGMHTGPMIVKDLGELQAKPAESIRMEYDPGLVIEDPFAVARLSSITDAAFVA